MKALGIAVGFCVVGVTGATLAGCALAPPVCMVGVYRDAVLYSGATDFVFELRNGTRVALRAEHGGVPLPGVDALLGGAIDGPAEPVGSRVGREHKICFEADETTIELATE